MAKIIIFGAGDIARLAYHYFKTDTEHEVIGFTVDKAFLKESTFLDLPLVAFEEVNSIYPPNVYRMFIGMSYAKMNKVREEKYNKAKEMGYELVSYISSKCTYLSQFNTGDNCFILEDNTIQPYVKIGNNVTLWSGNHIGHDAVLEDHIFIASQVVISGHVKIKSNVFIGVNATLRDNITIAKETLIGAGAIIMKNTIEKEVYVPERTKPFPKKSDELDF